MTAWLAGCVQPTSVVATAPEAEPAAMADPGAIVVIGGRLEPDNQALYRAMLELREGTGPVCVVPTASADPDASMQAYMGDFLRFGGPTAAVGVAIVDGDFDAVADPAVVARLRACSGFFFTGGDQSRIVDTFVPDGRSSPAAEVIRARHAAGAFVAGTSAGAAMMSDPMIGSGEPVAALEHGVCASDGCPGVWVREGMGFWPGWITDQHFLVRGRAGRLLAVVVGLEHGPRRGLGVDEDTGVIVRGGQAEVVGRSGALRIDASAATRRGETGSETWSGIVVDLYGPGDRFTLADGRLLEPPISAEVAEPRRLPEPPAAPFEGAAFVELLLAIAAAQPDPRPVTLTGEGWEVAVVAGPGFHAGAPRGELAIGSAGPFLLELRLAEP